MRVKKPILNIVVVVLMAWPGISSAQDARAILRKIAAQYDKNRLTEVNMLLRSYNLNKPLAIEDSINIMMVLKGTDVYCHYPTIDILQHDTIAMQVSHANKSITILNAKNLQQSKLNLYTLLSMVVTMQTYNPVIRPIDAKYNAVSFTLPGTRISKVEIVYDKKTIEAKTYTMEVATKTDGDLNITESYRVEYKVNLYKVSDAPFPIKKYGLGTYVVFKQGVWTPIDTYKNFKIINTLNN